MYICVLEVVCMYIYVCVRGGKGMKYVCCICMLYMHITCWHMLCAMSYRHVVLQKWVLSCTCYWINEEKMKRQGLAGMQMPPGGPTPTAPAL